MIHLPTTPFVVENLEEHMLKLRGPKDRTPERVKAENRTRWMAWIDGHPCAMAEGACPWAALATVAHLALFWAGVRDDLAPSCVIPQRDRKADGAPLFAGVA